MKTTLNDILHYGPCGYDTCMKNEPYGFDKLLKYLGKTSTDDEPLSFNTILASNGLQDAIWCTRVLGNNNPTVMRFKLLCMKEILHLDTTEELEMMIKKVRDKNLTRDSLMNEIMRVFKTRNTTLVLAIHYTASGLASASLALNRVTLSEDKLITLFKELFCNDNDKD